MISDRSSGRDGRVGAAAAALVAVVLAGCSSPSSPSSPSTTASTWSVGTPNASGSGAGGGASGGSATPGSPSSGSGGVPSATAGAPSGPTTAAGADGGSAAGPPVQPGGEAGRDGVPPSIAALPRESRVRQVPRGSGGFTRIATGDGVWMISRPAGSPESYAEVLHLDASGRILRAYPFPGVAPQWLLLTSKAVYCGRHGQTGSPDAMVCRIDRTTGDLRVRIIADLAPYVTLTEGDMTGRPGRWTLDDRNFVADLGVAPAPGTELTFRSRGGVLRLDPDTLGVLGS